MTTAPQQQPIITPSELAADLDALQRLPPSTLAKLIDPSAEPTPKPADATTQLAAFGPSSGPAASLALTTAYAAEMRDGAAKLRAQEIGGPASAIAGGRVCGCREVRGNVVCPPYNQRADKAALRVYIRDVDGV
ncbi:hypothetical protein CcaverHIS002_0409940 [Cutaneotrichosporon cavernicola]|nr:hypothetical protein CcaverHIS002_0409940 [Cutaneotrichosporon cavernicola]